MILNNVLHCQVLWRKLIVYNILDPTKGVSEWFPNFDSIQKFFPCHFIVYHWWFADTQSLTIILQVALEIPVSWQYKVHTVTYTVWITHTNKNTGKYSFIDLPGLSETIINQRTISLCCILINSSSENKCFYADFTKLATKYTLFVHSVLYISSAYISWILTTVSLLN